MAQVPPAGDKLDNDFNHDGQVNEKDDFNHDGHVDDTDRALGKKVEETQAQQNGWAFPQREEGTATVSP